VLQIPSDPQSSADVATEAEIPTTPANDPTVTTTEPEPTNDLAPATAILATTQSPNNVAPIATNTSTAKTPIQRAKAAIAQVPVTRIETFSDESPEPAQVKVIRVPAAPSLIATNSTATASSKSSQSAKQSTQAISILPKHLVEESKQKVSQYLSSIHIDSLRQGQRPMVIINGSRYEVGDTVHSPTKLKFSGINKGRLMFRDQHGIVYLKSF
jgi:hypothetical protein